MAIPLYLAQTSAEFASSAPKPERIAWMACHFSPYGTGITNIPKTLPEGSILILNDRTPVCGHDPATVSSALMQTVQRLHCSGILLDFQRSGCPQTAAVAAEIAKLPCPVAVSECYAKELHCTVFLSASPVHKPLAEYLAPWKDRVIWLEAAIGSTQITVTERGSQFIPLQDASDTEYPFYDELLHCKYRTEVEKDCIRFTLRRGKEEMHALLQEAGQLGVTRAVGLYQGLK